MAEKQTKSQGSNINNLDESEVNKAGLVGKSQHEFIKLSNQTSKPSQNISVSA